MAFNLKKEILLLLSLSFVSIAIKAKNDGEQCISDQECTFNQTSYCYKTPKLTKVDTGYVDENIGRCTTRDRGEQGGQFRPISREEMQRLQPLTSAPVSSSQIQEQPRLVTRMPTSTTSTGQSQLLTQTPVATR